MNSREGRARLLWVAGTLLAAGLLLLSLRLPLWGMTLRSPQYQGKDELHVRVYPNALRGDLHEIKILEQYIGVKIPTDLPQIHWLTPALLAGALITLLAHGLPRRWRSWVHGGVTLALGLFLLVCAGQAQWQMYRIGHHRNPHAALSDTRDFTPLLVGAVKIDNFEMRSGLGLGGGLIAAAMAVDVAVSWVMTRRRSPQTSRVMAPGSQPFPEGLKTTL